MIIFDQLRISDDGKRMYINVHVNNADYFENICLDSITIMTQDQVSETAPEMVTDDYIYKITFDDNQRQADLVLTPHDCNEKFVKSSFSKDLFFVYVKCKEAPLVGCPPCRLDELTTLGVTFDENMLYQAAMGYTKDLLKDCSVPQGFTDFILLWNAFKSSIETEHYVPAIKFWKMLFQEGSYNAPVITKNCGCHG
jgi:hypothetical protein